MKCNTLIYIRILARTEDLDIFNLDRTRYLPPLHMRLVLFLLRKVSVEQKAFWRAAKNLKRGRPVVIAAADMPVDGIQKLVPALFSFIPSTAA